MPPGRGAVDLIASRDVSRRAPTVAWTLTPSTSFRFALASASTASTALRFFFVKYRMARPQRLVLPVPPLPATAIVKPIKHLHHRGHSDAKRRTQSVPYSVLSEVNDSSLRTSS